MRVAVLGLYRSGSSAVAGVLHHLGVAMGQPFWQPLSDNAPLYYESASLADRLRAWWNEPILEETVPKTERVRFLAQWIEDQERTGAKHVGAKHPLLSLCGDDLLEAWGADMHWLWGYRPLEESIHSLISLGWWPGREESVQRRLWDSCTRFLAGRRHLRIDLADMTSQPAREVERIMQYVQITPEKGGFEAAVRCIRPRGQG